MNAALAGKMADNYLWIMQNWDDDYKKAFITKLSDSMNSIKRENHDFSACYGAWKDTRSAEEISKELYEDRKNSNEIENF